MIFPRPKFSFSHTWMISAVVTVALTGFIVAAMSFISVKKLVTHIPAPQKPFLELQRPSDYAEAMREQSLLMDQAPLFLPTFWNTARAGYVITGRLGKTELSQPFRGEVEIDAGMIAPQNKNSFSTVTAYSSEYNDSSATMKIGQGYSIKSKFVLQVRGAGYVVMDDKNGKKMLFGTVERPISEAGDLLWQPAEFWVRVVREGVSGNPLLASSSGSDTLDMALRKIVDTLDGIASLPPGYYKIIVGP